MELIKYVKEKGFELRIGAGFATYANVSGEIRIECTLDGDGQFSGEDTSFERLYNLLEGRPDLRMVTNTKRVYMDANRLDEFTTEEDALLYARIAQVTSWLGITTPYVS